MKIRVKDKEHNIRFWFPTGLFLSRPFAAAIARGARDKGVPLTGKQLHVLFKAIKRYRKEHKDWVLLEVDSKSGEKAFIKL